MVMKLLNTKILLFLISIILVVYIFPLDWGLPNRKKISQIFTDEEINTFVPKMVGLRKKFYSLVEKIHRDNNIEENIKQTYDHKSKSVPFKEIPQDRVLDMTRGYFLGTMNSDEQRNIVAISNLNPLKFDFNPDDFTYGGLYFYSVAASFVVGKIFGVLSLAKSIEYYFYHPQEVANMYLIIRILSLLGIIGSAILLFLLSKRFFGDKVTLLSVLLLLCIPIVVINAKTAKPHTLGMFFVLFGSWFCIKIFDEESIKNYILSSILFGISFALLYSNAVSILILQFTILIKNNFKLKSVVNKKVIIATIIFLTIFLLTNWYIIPDFGKFLRRKKELEIIFNYGNLNLIASAMFLKDFFITNLPIILLPMTILGVAKILKDKLTVFYPILFFVLIYFLIVVIYLKHPNVFIICLPFISIFSALGIESLFNKSIVSKIYCVLIIVVLIISSIYGNFSCKIAEKRLVLAGQWINKNIAEFSSIGVIDGYFCVGSWPPFKFLKYKLIHLPSEQLWSKENLPDYLILVNNQIEKFSVYTQKDYNSTLSYGNFLDKMFFYIYPSLRIKIYKKYDWIL